MQDLINQAEAKYPHVRYEDELADHLEGRAHPLPHPETYCHGYVRPYAITYPKDGVIVIGGMTAGGGAGPGHRPQGSTPPKPTQRPPVVIKHPGPVTMEEHGNWNWGAIIAFVLLSAFWFAAWWLPRLFK